MMKKILVTAAAAVALAVSPVLAQAAMADTSWSVPAQQDVTTPTTPAPAPTYGTDDTSW